MPGCGVLVQKGRCPKHAKQQDLRRGTALERGYDARWATFSRAWRRRLPLCGMRADGSMDTVNSRCAKDGLTTPAECVDHVIPMSQGGDQYDENNLISSCLACNSWKARTIERKTVSR
jgi:5-methylcytosine-specific restriction endonuclease McrA